MQMLVAMEEHSAWIVGQEVDFHRTVRGDAYDVLDEPRTSPVDDADDFKAMTMQTRQMGFLGLRSAAMRLLRQEIGGIFASFVLLKSIRPDLNMMQIKEEQR